MNRNPKRNRSPNTKIIKNTYEKNNTYNGSGSLVLGRLQHETD